MALRIITAKGGHLAVKPVDVKPKAALDSTGAPVLDGDGHPTFKNGVATFDEKGTITGFVPARPYRVVATGADLLHVNADKSSAPYGKPEALISQATFDLWASDVRAAYAALDEKARAAVTGSTFARTWTDAHGLTVVADGQPNDAPDVIDAMFADMGA